MIYLAGKALIYFVLVKASFEIQIDVGITVLAAALFALAITAIEAGVSRIPQITRRFAAPLARFS